MSTSTSGSSTTTTTSSRRTRTERSWCVPSARTSCWKATGGAPGSGQFSRNWWYHTGDVGRIDGDRYLYFVDRKADYLRRRGENISSFEVESVLMSHGALADVAVHAVPSVLTEDDLKVTAVLKANSSCRPTSSSCRAWLTCRILHFRAISSSGTSSHGARWGGSSSVSCERRVSRPTLGMPRRSGSSTNGDDELRSPYGPRWTTGSADGRVSSRNTGAYDTTA